MTGILQLPFRSSGAAGPDRDPSSSPVAEDFLSSCAPRRITPQTVGKKELAGPFEGKGRRGPSRHPGRRNHQERSFMRILIVLLAFAAFNLLTLTTPEAARQNLAAWATLAGRR
jgi:hypothetical protein